jgi:Tol biopolymer transport system component
VIHRDIKPGNIILTRNGTKLLDFGLAKLRQETSPGVRMSRLTTLKENPTAEGTILGTLQYMSPEQLEGKLEEIDGRTDIFSLGMVVYEMATGRRAFEGRSSASLIGAILKDNPPPISSLRPMTPPALDRVVKRCLAKDPEDRWQTARDLEMELKWIAEGGPQAGSPAPASSRHDFRRWITWALAATAVVLALLMASIVYFRPTPSNVAPVYFSVAPPDNGVFPPLQNFPNSVSLSPDGSKLAFVATNPSGRSQLWIRSLDSPAALPLPGTDNGHGPFWSPDSRFLAFYVGGKLKKIAVSGGPAQTLVEDAPLATYVGGTWNHAGVILFTRYAGGGYRIERVSAAGGTSVPATTFDNSRQEYGHAWPDFLPDGNHFLYSASNANAEKSAIYIGSLDSKERRLLLNANSNAVYVPGYLLFNRQGTLLAQPFDSRRLELAGEAVPVAEGIASNASSGGATFSASENGVLAYRRGDGSAQRTLVWVSRDGTERPVAAPPRNYQQPRLSPDERRLALQIDEGGAYIWLYDLARETLTRLTFDRNQNETPLWTRDGSRVVFYAPENGPLNLYWQLADGTGQPERLLASQVNHVPMSWSPDGSLLAFTQATFGRDIWVLSLADRKARPFLQTPSIEGGAQFSPDGRWMAYVSDESGRAEIYVQPYPGPGGKWQISADGGTEPMWNPNGRELFYRSGNHKMMAVDVTLQPSFSAGAPRLLFERQYVFTPLPQTFPYYDVSRDGQRFLMVKESAAGASEQIHVVVNWIEDLRRRLPAGTK